MCEISDSIISRHTVHRRHVVDSEHLDNNVVTLSCSVATKTSSYRVKKQLRRDAKRR